MNLIANRPFVPPLIQTHPKVIERGAIRIQWASIRSNYTDALRCEVQHLPEFLLALAQCRCENLVLRDVDPGSDEPLGHSAVFSWRADAPDMTNRSVRPHDPLCEVECPMLRLHGPNFLRDRISV